MPLALTADGGLGIEVSGDVEALVRRWLPRDLPVSPSPGRALISISIGEPRAAPQSLPTLTVGPVRGWLEGRRLVLRGVWAAGDVDLDRGRAELRAAPSSGGGEAAELDVYGMLTISAGVLLAGLGRALIHGAAVAPPGPDGAWLLVGDSGTGKSTTCAALARAGWLYLSDDQVVLAPAERGVTVEGWIRPFHLDAGWDRGVRTGTREAVDPAVRFPGGRRRLAPLAGILLPRVAADRPTAAAPADPGAALAELVRQSPWVLLDRGAAPRVLELLGAAVTRCRPPRHVSLGADCYGAPDRLVAALAAPA